MNEVAVTDAPALGNSSLVNGNVTITHVDPNQRGSGFYMDSVVDATVFHAPYATVKLFLGVDDLYDVVRRKDNNINLDIEIDITPSGVCEYFGDVIKRFDVTNGDRATVRGFCQWSLRVLKLEDPVKITWKLIVPTSCGKNCSYYMTTLSTILISSWHLHHIHQLTEDVPALDLDIFFEESSFCGDFPESVSDSDLDSSLEFLPQSPYSEIE